MLSNDLTLKFRETALNIIGFFYNNAKKLNKSDAFKTKYNYLVSEFRSYDEDYKTYDAIQNELIPIYQDAVPIKLAEKINKNIKNIEIKFKEIIQQKISLNQLDQEEFETYLERKRNYFTKTTFQEKNLEILISALQNFIEKQNIRLTKLKKEFLEFQLGKGGYV